MAQTIVSVVHVLAARGEFRGPWGGGFIIHLTPSPLLPIGIYGWPGRIQSLVQYYRAYNETGFLEVQNYMAHVVNMHKGEMSSKLTDHDCAQSWAPPFLLSI